MAGYLSEISRPFSSLYSPPPVKLLATVVVLFVKAVGTFGHLENPYCGITLMGITGWENDYSIGDNIPTFQKFHSGDASLLRGCPSRNHYLI